MPAGTPDEWLFEDWQLIAHALTATTHENCRCYECDTIDTEPSARSVCSYVETINTLEVVNVPGHDGLVVEKSSSGNDTIFTVDFLSR